MPPFCLYAKYTDKIIIKLRYGDHFLSSPKSYHGSSIKYVDMHDVDDLSLLEIGNMLEEFGDTISLYEISYKLPSADFDTDLCPLVSDELVLQMCNVVSSTRIMYVYVVSEVGVMKEYLPSQYDLSFIDYHDNIKFEIIPAKNKGPTSQTIVTTIRYLQRLNS